MATHRQRICTAPATATRVGPVAAQQRDSPRNRCFRFAPPGEAIEPIDTGLVLGPEAPAVTGDIRTGARFAEAPGGGPNITDAQQTTRTRFQFRYAFGEQIHALAEFHSSASWDCSGRNSDAQPTSNPSGLPLRKNSNGIGQASLRFHAAFDRGNRCGSIATAMTLDHHDDSEQLGDSEIDRLVIGDYDAGHHQGLRYGRGNEDRQIGFRPITFESSLCEREPWTAKAC